MINLLIKRWINIIFCEDNRLTFSKSVFLILESLIKIYKAIKVKYAIFTCISVVLITIIWYVYHIFVLKSCQPIFSIEFDGIERPNVLRVGIRLDKVFYMPIGELNEIDMKVTLFNDKNENFILKMSAPSVNLTGLVTKSMTMIDFDLKSIENRDFIYDLIFQWKKIEIDLVGTFKSKVAPFEKKIQKKHEIFKKNKQNNEPIVSLTIIDQRNGEIKLQLILNRKRFAPNCFLRLPETEIIASYKASLFIIRFSSFTIHKKSQIPLNICIQLDKTSNDNRIDEILTFIWENLLYERGLIQSVQNIPEIYLSLDLKTQKQRILTKMLAGTRFPCSIMKRKMIQWREKRKQEELNLTGSSAKSPFSFPVNLKVVDIQADGIKIAIPNDQKQNERVKTLLKHFINLVICITTEIEDSKDEIDILEFKLCEEGQDRYLYVRTSEECDYSKIKFQNCRLRFGQKDSLIREATRGFSNFPISRFQKLSNNQKTQEQHPVNRFCDFLTKLNVKVEKISPESQQFEISISSKMRPLEIKPEFGNLCTGPIVSVEFAKNLQVLFSTDYLNGLVTTKKEIVIKLYRDLFLHTDDLKLFLKIERAQTDSSQLIFEDENSVDKVIKDLNIFQNFKLFNSIKFERLFNSQKNNKKPSCLPFNILVKQESFEKILLTTRKISTQIEHSHKIHNFKIESPLAIPFYYMTNKNRENSLQLKVTAYDSKYIVISFIFGPTGEILVVNTNAKIRLSKKKLSNLLRNKGFQKINFAQIYRKCLFTSCLITALFKKDFNLENFTGNPTNESIHTIKLVLPLIENTNLAHLGENSYKITSSSETELRNNDKLSINPKYWSFELENIVLTDIFAIKSIHTTRSVLQIGTNKTGNLKFKIIDFNLFIAINDNRKTEQADSPGKNTMIDEHTLDLEPGFLILSTVAVINRTEDISADAANPENRTCFVEKKEFLFVKNKNENEQRGEVIKLQIFKSKSISNENQSKIIVVYKIDLNVFLLNEIAKFFLNYKLREIYTNSYLAKFDYFATSAQEIIEKTLYCAKNIFIRKKTDSDKNLIKLEQNYQQTDPNQAIYDNSFSLYSESCRIEAVKIPENLSFHIRYNGVFLFKIKFHNYYSESQSEMIISHTNACRKYFRNNLLRSLWLMIKQKRNEGRHLILLYDVFYTFKKECTIFIQKDNLFIKEFVVR